jgi:1-deoxyxylulose-5-phosphate synthase
MNRNRPGMNYQKPNPDTYGLPFTVDDYQDMPYRIFGNSGLRVPNVGLGTWKFGLPETRDGARVDEKTSLRIMDRAIELGVTFWDTANRYNNSSGNSERVIGTWLKANPEMRRHVVLASKLFGMTDGKTPNHCRLSRVNILESTYASLERMGTDAIEVMQFHKFDDSTPVEESLMAVEDLISQDIIRYFGVSNFTVEDLKSYFAYEDELRRSRIQSVQNRFDMLYGESEGFTGVMQFCEEESLSFIPWGPLRQGLLTERYLDKAKVRPGDRLLDENMLDSELTAPVLGKLNKLAVKAEKYHISLAQLSIAYLLQLPAMGPVIVSSSTVEQLEENAGAGTILLDPDTIGEIEAVIGTETK